MRGINIYELSLYFFLNNIRSKGLIRIPKPKRKPRSDTEVCCLCNKRHKLENISCCWEGDCQIATDEGTYCNNGMCYEDHVKRCHPEILEPDTRKAKVYR